MNFILFLFLISECIKFIFTLSDSSVDLREIFVGVQEAYENYEKASCTFVGSYRKLLWAYAFAFAACYTRMKILVKA